MSNFKATNKIDDYDPIEINEDSYHYDTYEQDINQTSSSYENDQLNKNHPRGPNKHHANLRKKNFPRKFHNRTSSSFKYQINKSTRVIENENGLQSFDGELCAIFFSRSANRLMNIILKFRLCFKRGFKNMCSFRLFTCIDCQFCIFGPTTGLNTKDYTKN